MREGYKDSEIGIIPVEWEVVNFKNFFSSVGAKKYQVQKSKYLQNGKYPIIDQGQKFIVGYSNEDDKVYKNIDGVIVFGDHTRIIKFIDFHFVIGADGTQLLKCIDGVNQKFSYYVLSSKELKNLGYSRHFKLVKEMKFPLPPLKEQEKIADILSTADDKIDAIASQIEICETVKKGLLQKLLSEGIGHSEFKESELGKIPLGWEVLKLKDIFKMKSGSTPYRKNLSYFDGGSIYWIKTLDLNNGYITNSQEKITKKALAETSCSLLPINSILIAMYGGYKQIGRTGVLSIEATTNQAITALFPNDKVVSNFINYILIFYRYKWKGVATSSRKDPNITKKDIENFKIPLSPLQEQNQIADILSTADEKIEILRAKKQKYETLKKGLLQKLLSGEIRV